MRTTGPGKPRQLQAGRDRRRLRLVQTAHRRAHHVGVDDAAQHQGRLERPQAGGRRRGRAGAGRADDVEQADEPVLFGPGDVPVALHGRLVQPHIAVRVHIAQTGYGTVGAAQHHRVDHQLVAREHREPRKVTGPDDEAPERAVVPAGVLHPGEHPVGRERQQEFRVQLAVDADRHVVGQERQVHGRREIPEVAVDLGGMGARVEGCGGHDRVGAQGGRGAGPLGGPVGGGLDGPDEDRDLAGRRRGDHLDDLVLPAGCQVGRLARTSQGEQAVDPAVEEMAYDPFQGGAVELAVGGERRHDGRDHSGVHGGGGGHAVLLAGGTEVRSPGGTRSSGGGRSASGVPRGRTWPPGTPRRRRRRPSSSGCGTGSRSAGWWRRAPGP